MIASTTKRTLHAAETGTGHRAPGNEPTKGRNFSDPAAFRSNGRERKRKRGRICTTTSPRITARPGTNSGGGQNELFGVPGAQIGVEDFLLFDRCLSCGEASGEQPVG